MNTEITKQSVELRRILFKDTKITSSKELKNLYLKLNHISIQKLRMKYYHVKENKTVEINKGKFVPDNISKKSYIMTHTTIGLENQKLEVYGDSKGDKEILNAASIPHYRDFSDHPNEFPLFSLNSNNKNNIMDVISF